MLSFFLSLRSLLTFSLELFSSLKVLASQITELMLVQDRFLRFYTVYQSLNKNLVYLYNYLIRTSHLPCSSVSIISFFLALFLFLSFFISSNFIKISPYITENFWWHYYYVNFASFIKSSLHITFI